MSSAHALPASATPRTSRTSSLLPRFAWIVLGYNVAVVLWGAVVRATSSGAGCGDHWPLCNGVVVQTHPRLATLIELAHRMTSGITVIAILLLLVWVFRSTLAGHLARFTVVAATVTHFQRSVAGRSVGSAAADRRQPLPRTRGLSFAAPGQYSAAAGGTHAVCALPLRRRKFPSADACVFRNCQALLPDSQPSCWWA